MSADIVQQCGDVGIQRSKPGIGEKRDVEKARTEDHKVWTIGISEEYMKIGEFIWWIVHSYKIQYTCIKV